MPRNKVNRQVDRLKSRFNGRHNTHSRWKIAKWPASAAAALAIALSTASNASAQTTLTFQQGVDSYTGALDTRIVSTSTADQSAAVTMGIDGGASAFMDGSWSQGLFRFDSLFGAGASQIPLNATITSATLSLVTGTASNDQSGNSFGIYRLNSGFTAGATWANSFGGDGINVGLETAAADDTKQGGAQGATVTFSVLNSLNFWKTQADPNAANLGWALSTIAGTDAWTFGTSNNTNAALRPLLSISYVVPRNVTWNAANATGVWENDNGANQVWTDNATTLGTSYQSNPADNVFFSQDVVGQVDVTVNGVNPTTMTVSHNSGTYAFSGGSITSLLTKTGNGNLVLNAPNSFSSANLSGGTVEVNTADAFGTAGTVTLAGGVTLHPTLTTFNDPALGFTFNTTSTVQVDTGNTYQIYGITGGNGALTKTGAGTLEFRGTSGFNGSIDIQGGRVLLANPSGPGGDLNVTLISVQNGATFQFGGTTPSTEENPDLPDATFITVNNGGTATFTVGEQYGGITLNGGTFNNTLALEGTSSWVNAAPSTLMSGAMNGTALLTVGAAHTVNKTTSGTVTVTGLPINIAGTVNLQQGTFSTDAQLTGTGAMNIGSATDNATLQLRATAPTTYSKSFDIGAGGATVDVSEVAGDIAWSGTIGGAGELTKAGPGRLSLTGLNHTTGPVRIAAGKLAVSGISNGGQAGALGASSSSAANLVLDGGTLQYVGVSGTSNRGFTVGNSGGTFEVSNATTKITLTGATAGGGNFTKTGPGMLVLAGTNQYGGSTTVAEGNLSVAPFAATGGFTVASGAVLTTQVPTLSSSLSMPTLSLASGGASLNFEMQAAGVPTSSLIRVTDLNGVNLNSSSHTINVQTGGPLPVGVYKLIDYSGTSINSGFQLGVIGGRATSNLVYNAADTRIDLNVTSTDTIRWAGNVSADWDLGSAANVGGTNNWKLNSNSSATNFIAGDIVTFDDTAAGNFNVNLTTAVNPGLVTVNNSTQAYSFQGSGKITGLGSLVKSGTGMLTLETNNDYTGDTTINSGTLQIGNGGSSGSIGTGQLVNNASLVVNRSDNLALNGSVSGSGSLTKLGTNTLTLSGNYAATGNISISGGAIEFLAAQPTNIVGNVTGAGMVVKTGDSTLTLAGNNTYEAGTTISAGTLVAANATGSATGTGTTTIAAGATLQIGNGATAGSVGGSVDSGPVGSVGNIVINRSDDFSIPANITGAGPIVKNGTGKASLTGNLSYSGPTTISDGTLAIAPASDFTYSAATAVGSNTLEINSAANVRFNNPVTGTGNLVKNGSGNAIFNGDSTFSGTLTVNEGAFILQDDQLTTGFAGDIDAATIVVNNGGRFQFGSGQNITGENPDLPGNTYITVNSGGVVDWYIGEDFGGLHIKGGAITLRGSAVISNNANLNLTSTNSDSIWESGTLTGINGTGVPAVGNVGVITKTTSGTLTVNNVTVNNTGGINIQDGTLSTNAGFNNAGTLTFGTNGVGATTGTLLLTNSAAGAIASTKPVTINAGGGVINVATAGKIYNYNGAVTGTGSFTKDGPGILQLGNVNNAYVGTTTVNGGVLRVNGTHNSGGAYTVNTGGTLGGTGTIGSTVGVNAGGILAPGAGVGTLAIAAANIAGKLNVEYDGTASTIDRLNITGLLNLSGASIDFDNLGTAALGGGPFVFASYGSLSGTFASLIDLPAGFSIDYDYNGNQIALVVGPALQAGDFDSDGDVDGADFIAWQTNFPTTTSATRVDGDNDADGDVDGADFAAWQNGFPTSPGPGTSPVPEPQTIVLLSLGGLFALAYRRKKSRA